MFLTRWTVFFQLLTFGVVLFIFGACVIYALAFRASVLCFDSRPFAFFCHDLIIPLIKKNTPCGVLSILLHADLTFVNSYVIIKI